MEQENRHNIHNILQEWHSFKFRLVIEGVIVGIVAGSVVVLFRYLLEKSSELTIPLYSFLKTRFYLIPIWFIALLIIGVMVGKMVVKEPMIGGSGIPQVEGLLQGHFTMNWWKVVIGKFIGGVLAIGAGLSLGREGPSVQLGAAMGQGFSRVFKRLKIEGRYLVTSGASAGLAAAFGAPLAGVMFALEEVHKSFSPLVLLSAMSASVTADFISKEIFGLKPVFNITHITVLPLNYYFYLIVLGIILGVLGVVFNKVLIKTQDLYGITKWLPVYLRPIVPLIAAGVLGFILPEVLGGGNNLVTELVSGGFTLKFLCVLLIAKFLFTMVSYGSGVPGGIFLPLLVVGALIGDLYGNTVTGLFHISSGFTANFIILAMAGYFTAVVRAPITGSILITEMTGSFSHLLSLIVVSIFAYITAEMLGSKPIYEELLERSLHNKGYGEYEGDSKKKIILEVAVCMGTVLDGRAVKEFQWPSHCLLVGIKRGKNEIIPKGNTVMYPGDYLIVLTDEEESARVRERLVEMASRCIIEN